MDLAGDLAAGMRAAVAGIAGAGPFLADWPDGVARRAQQPSALPVCRWLAGMAGGLAGQVAAGAGALSWRQTYGAGDFGAEFLQITAGPR